MKIDTPANIQTLLHYWCISDQPPHTYEPEYEIIDSATELLHRAGALEKKNPDVPPRFSVTPKGAAWIRALCNVEMPREVYVDQNNNILE